MLRKGDKECINKAFPKSYMKVVVKKLLRTGMTWRVHAVEMAPTERLKLKRQMAAAAAGKKSTTSLSLFMAAYGFEGEEELSPWPLSTGQESGRENGIMNKKKLGSGKFKKFRCGDR